MSRGRRIQCFDYVNHPYDQVRNALKANALAVFHRATKGAAARTEAVGSQLHVNFAGVDVGADIEISIGKIEEATRPARFSPITRVDLEWKAKHSTQLFPLMKASLSIYPLTATETQLDFTGTYRPPLGILGSAVDSVIGHRIAEAAIHRFMTEVSEYLRSTLPRGLTHGERRPRPPRRVAR